LSTAEADGNFSESVEVWQCSTAIIFAMKFKLSAVISDMGETTVADCSGVMKLDVC
jgi:hypothetical protein